MPMPATTTGIIHIKILCTPAKSNAVVSIGIMMPPMGTPPGGETGTKVKSATLFDCQIC